MVMAAGVVTAPSTAHGEDGEMCPPVTIEDLFPSTTTTVVPDSEVPETSPADTSTTTEAPPASDVDEGAPSTSLPATTATTLPPETTTTLPPEPECTTPFVYPMVFPLLGTADVISPFGAPRDGGARHHLGNDVAASPLQPVVAVADGVVTRIAGDYGISGNRIHIRHGDGWSTLYIHLNNDTAGTDDGNGTGVRPDLSEGDRVEAGEVIGWNGDSGNAEGTVHHLHFELRDPSGTAVDPGASLAAAIHLPDTPFQGPFSDLIPTSDPDPMVLLLSRGVPVWCDTPYTACPDDLMDADMLATWLEVLAGLEPELEAESVDDHSAACDTAECAGITELDVARYLVWVRMRQAHERWAPWLRRDIPDLAWTTPPPEPPDEPGSLSLGTTYQALGGSTRCLPRFDDESALSRHQAAATLLLYLGWDSVDNCPTNAANR
jgi:hypothetical protein